MGYYVGLDISVKTTAVCIVDEDGALVREVAAEATVLLIEHNMSVVMELADKITVLNFGRILAEGTPAEIRANHDVQSAYLGVS